MAEPVPNDDPEIARLNALLEQHYRPILIEHLAIPGGGEDVPDPEAERASIYVDEVPPHRTIIINWPESQHSDAPRKELKAAVLAALPAELQGYSVLIT